METWLESITTALANLGGKAALPDLYREIGRVRGEVLSEEQQTIVRREILNHSSDSDGFRGGPDLFYSVRGKGLGVWGLRSSLKPTPIASDIEEPPKRILTHTYRVLRDTELALKIKALHKNACQICGLTLALPRGKNYSEAHHIIPLGTPHNGPDTAANIIVLCPNHHTLLDYGAVQLEASTLRAVEGHRIGRRYIQYHNERVCNPDMRSNTSL